MEILPRFTLPVPFGIAAILALVLLAAALTAGCTAPSAAAGDTTPVVSNGAILRDPGAYTGKEIVLKGTISTECGSGCWFLLDDGTGTIYVDLNQHNFAIPQLQGSRVTVKGTIRVENGDPKLYATNVTTGGRTYP